LVQALPQQISKEMMIAVPTPLVVQGDDEQVGGFERFQNSLAVILYSSGSSGGTGLSFGAWRFGSAETHGIAQRATQAVKD
jgi:hypothetical protein